MIPTAVIAAQLAGTLEYFETSRVDLRSNQPLPVVPSPPPREIALAGDASIAPTARLRLNDRHWDLALSYAPSFTVTDFELTTEAQPVVLNAGSVSLGWHDRRVRVVLSESGSYGWENLAYLYGTPVAGQAAAPGQSQTPGQGLGGTGQGTGQTSPGQTGQTPGQTGQSVGQTGTQPVVPITLFPFGSSSSFASVAVRASRAVFVAASGGYSISGNLANNAQASAVYPEQYGPSGSVSVGYAPSASDVLSTVASAGYLTTPQAVCLAGPAATTASFCHEETPTVTLQETARHELSRTATATASLGASATIYQLNSGPAWGILPVATVVYAQRLGPPPKDARAPVSGARLALELVPGVNVFTGFPTNRVQATASLTNRLDSTVGVTFTASALQTLDIPHPDPSPLTLLSGGVEVRARLDALVSFAAGVQAFWQAQQNVGALPGVTTPASTGTTTSGSEVGYLSLTVRAPILKL